MTRANALRVLPLLFLILFTRENASAESLSDGIVCYLPMQGSPVDLSGSGNDGDWRGGDGAYVDGVVGSAARIDVGRGERISIASEDGGAPDDLQEGGGDLTVAAWVRMESDPPLSDLPIMANKRRRSGLRAGWMIVMTGSSAFLEGQVSDGANARYVDSDERSLRGGDWHHVVLVISHRYDFQAMYFDGVVSDWQSEPSLGNIVTEEPTLIGRIASDDDLTTNDLGNLALEVDEFTVWRRALLQADVHALEEANRAGVGVLDANTGPILVIEETRRLPFHYQGAAATYTDTGVVRVRNGGDAALHLTDRLSSGAFQLEFGVTPRELTLDPGESGEITVVWTPSEGVLQPRAPVLVIEHNGTVSNLAEPDDSVTEPVTIDLGGDVVDINHRMVVHLRFDDAAPGFFPDTSSDGDNNPARWVGGTGYGITTGPIGRALMIPDTDGAEYATFADAEGEKRRDLEIRMKPNFSVNFWARCDATLDEGKRYTILMGDKKHLSGGAASPGWWIARRHDFLDPAGVAVDTQDVEGRGYGLQSRDALGPGVFPDDQWRMITVVLDRDDYIESGEAHRLYIDGERAAGWPLDYRAPRGLIASDYPVNIGQNGPADAGPEGGETSVGDPLVLDDLAVWHRSLKPGEVREIYLAGLKGDSVDAVRPRAQLRLTPDVLQERRAISAFEDYNSPGWFYLGEARATSTSLAIGNAGLRRLEIKDLHVVGPDADEFELSPSGGLTLRTDERQTIVVTWRPDDASTGTRRAVLRFEHNDAEFDSPFQIDLGDLTIADGPDISRGLSEGLLAHLKFDGDYRDSSGNGLNGTVIDQQRPGSELSFVPGVAGWALRFDGRGDYVRLDDSARELRFFNGDSWTTGEQPNFHDGLPDAFTAACWVRAPRYAFTNDWFREAYANNWGMYSESYIPSFGYNAPIVGNGILTLTEYPGWMLSLSVPTASSASFRGFFSDGFNQTIPGSQSHNAHARAHQTPSGLLDRRWHHVALVAQQGERARFYVDGARREDDSAQADLAEIGSLVSGKATSAGADGWGGSWGAFPLLSVDDLGVWNRALRPWEIDWIYTIGLQGADFASDFDFTVRSATRDDAWYLYE